MFDKIIGILNITENGLYIKIEVKTANQNDIHLEHKNGFLMIGISEI